MLELVNLWSKQLSGIWDAPSAPLGLAGLALGPSHDWGGPQSVSGRVQYRYNRTQ